MPKRKWGWVRDLPDHRDYEFSLKPVKLPPSVDLRPYCPAVYDQGSLGSCTGNAIAGCIETMQKVLNVADNMPSRLFIYYNERAMEGSVNQDAGASIRDGMKSVGKQGFCSEKNWPYKIPKFKTKPPASCYKEGLKNTIDEYQRLPQDLISMKMALASNYPFVYGFSVYESFESAQVTKTGVVPMPSKSESLLGGHAVLCVGFDDKSARFLCRNSWGKWGMGGYFTIPYQYLASSKLASDFWTVKLL